jgi:hypothetical protein
MSQFQVKELRNIKNQRKTICELTFPKNVNQIDEKWGRELDE